ncbi:hypothetical protein JOC48_003275 [Aquibacillus albus]|uniref:Uncharacterized protein n=2 Tax=Aquibacillus albus TaxID=1168171 RepID=A0ABS2N3S6_9BACI|nr:hypothetical protein [Aquibacillus albus]
MQITRVRTHGDPSLWNTLDVRKGYKFQQHEFAEHYRILDANNLRVHMGVDSNSARNTFLELTNEELWIGNM